MCQPEIMKRALVLKSLAKKHVIPPEANVEFLIWGCLNAGKLGWMCQNVSSFLFNTSAPVNIDICLSFSVLLFPSDEHAGVSVCLLNV